MNPLIKKLEERLLPEFEQVAEQIRQEISNVWVRVSSFPVGSDEYLAQGYCIECILTYDLKSESDLVALCIELSHLMKIPKISADVCWGSPSGRIEADFPKDSNNSIEVTDEVLEDLYKDLPRLYEALFEALKRRKPADE